MTRAETTLYVLRRKDTGEFYKRTKSGYLKSWKPDDPRRRFWTPDLELATLYPWKGIKVLATQTRNSVKANLKYGAPDFEIEIVRLKIVEDGVVDK